MAASDCVKVGDIVTLRNLKMNVYVSAEGFISDDLFVTESGVNFDDNLFQVCLQRQYSAAKELEEYMLASRDSSNFDPNPLTNKYLQALQRGRDNENKLNESYMSQKWGNKVFYGDVVQLMHTKSKKYITVMPNMVSSCERENLKIYLSASGNPFSWLQILPRFKIDRRGDRILNEAEVLLKLSERANEFVHCADRVRPGHAQEINSSLEATSWRMKIFQNSSESADFSLLLPSQLFYIHDPETKANLAIFEPRPHLSANDDSTVDEDEFDGDDAKLARTQVVIEPLIESEPNSNALWSIECKNVALGTPVLYKTDVVKLRHFASGRYLLLSKPINKNMQKNLLNLEALEVGVTSDKNPTGSNMSVHQLYGGSNFLLNEKVVQLSCDHTYLERGDLIFNDTDGIERHLCKGTRQKGTAMNFVVKRYSPSSADGDAATKALDVHICSSVRSYFSSVLAMTVPPDLSGASGTPIASTIWPRANKEDINTFNSVISRVVNYLDGYPISYDPEKDVINLKSISGLKYIISERKSLCRELGCIKIVFELVGALVHIMDTWFYHGWEARAAAAEVMDAKRAVHRMVSGVTKQCMRIVLNCCRDHFSNQSFAASYIHLILSLVGREPVAADLISEMLSKNKELQDTKIGRREIGLFVEQMQPLLMNSMNLELLRACCSCEGKAVLKNQRLVCETMFPHLDDVFIFLNMNPDNIVESLPWPHSTVYPFPDEIDAGAMCYAVGLLKGLSEITATWKTSESEYSTEDLFGAKVVPLIDIFRNYNPRSVAIPRMASIKTVEANSVQERQMSCGKYLIEVILLAAELCLDRYHRAIRKFEKLFPYDMLVAILRMDSVGGKLKGSAARLLTNCHISKEPIPTDPLPRMTRVWHTLGLESDGIAGGSTVVTDATVSGYISHLPCVDGDRINRHVILQYILSSYLRDMRGARKWDASSVDVIRLLHELVRLRFYGTGPRLKELVRLIAQVLRRPQSGEEKDTSILGIGRSTSLFSRRLTSGKTSDGADSSASLSGGNKVVNMVDDMEPRWEEAALTVLMSVNVLMLMLALVVVALVLNGYVFVLGITNPIFTYVDYGVTLVFIIELTLRTYCYYIVKGDMVNFYTDPFTIVDYVVVFLDILIFALGSVLGSIGGFTKSLRLLRLLRLLRIMRAGRILKSIVGIEVDDEVKWTVPPRYLEPDAHEVSTMFELVQILLTVQEIIDDRNLTLLLTDFYNWTNEGDSHSSTPGQLFAGLPARMNDLALVTGDNMDTFFDLLMYNSHDLCQGVLEILMEQHVSLALLLENSRKVQLLVKPWREKQFAVIQKQIARLEFNIENHDAWGMLDNDDALQTANETLEILKELTEICRIRRRVLEFDESYKADKQTQNMLRACGCLRICNLIIDKLKTFGVDKLSDVGMCNIKILTACNELLSWFLTENADNQESAFPFFTNYLGTIDSGINSHSVIKALFRGNETLMRKVPMSRIDEFIELICDEGRFPQYLCLLGSIVTAGDNNIPENQYEIIRQITMPSRVKKCLAFFCPVVSAEYARKVKLMAPYLNKKDIEVDALPAELAYHLELLHVLSGCTAGSTNITTVETKVQGMYHYHDLVEALLDPNSLQVVKNRLGLFFYNAMIDVEMVIPGFQHAKSVWIFLESCVKVFQIAKDELRLIERQGWESPAACRQRVEYTVICAMIVGGFFFKYFDPVVFYRDDGTFSSGNEMSDQRFTPTQVNNLAQQLFNGLKGLHDLDSPILSSKNKQYIYFALLELNKIKAVPVAINEPIIHVGKSDEEELDLVLPSGKASCSKLFVNFLSDIQSSEEAQATVAAEFQSMISKIEKLPPIKDVLVSDIRYEAIIEKLVSHIQGSIYKVIYNLNPEKRMNPSETKTAIWIIRMFRAMIENRWGMTIYERDDDGGEEQDEACAELVGVLNARGATVLCLDLIAVGIDKSLVNECIKLCVAMLFKEGGSLAVQETMFNHLSTSDSLLFFKELRVILRSLMDWHEEQGVTFRPNEQRPVPEGQKEAEDIPEEIIVVRFMQLMCEGHYCPNQDILREQPNNKTGSINMLDDLAEYIISLIKIPCATSTEAALAVSATCLEVIQGPCEGNQEYFALNTLLIEMVNRLMRMPSAADGDADDEMELKKTGIDIIQGLLEGQAKKPAVYEKVLSVLHLDIIQMFCGGSATEGEELSEAAIALQTECLVLIQMLCDFKPGLKEELELPDLDALVGSNVACVEVMWRGELQRRFFNVPEICSDLAKSAKDNLVEYVDRKSQENKLIDLVYRARGLYKEIQHQQTLRKYNIAGVFSRKNQDIATWFCFWIACAVNLVFLLYYNSKHCEQDPYPDDDSLPECKEPVLTGPPTIAVAVFNYLQLFFSSFTLVLFLVVRVPVLFASRISQGDSTVVAACVTALDPMTMYYFIYVIVAAMGISLRPLITFLLLDLIVKNTYARDVFVAIVFPWRALFMSTLLMLFVVFIFTYYFFLYYNNEQHLPVPEDCETLWGCFKFVTGYGKEGDISMYLEIDSYNRWLYDFMFCLLLKFTLLNVVRGINVDTFAELRGLKMERLADTTEICFVCGIDKLTFDRNDNDHGFVKHIRNEHNMWNYLYFIIYLWEQDKDDDDGMEQYVRRCIDSYDISWFPVGRALCLSHEDSNEAEELAANVKNDLINMNKSVLRKIAELEECIGNKVFRIDLSVNMDDSSQASTQSEMSKSMSAFKRLSSRAPNTRRPNSRAGMARAMTMNTRDYGIKHSKMVLLEPVELTGIGSLFDERFHGRVTCRICSRAGVYDIPRSTHKDGIHMKFDPSEVCVCSQLHSALNLQHEKVKVQIYVEDLSGSKKYVGSLEISLDELVSDSTMRIEKSFIASFADRSVEGRFIFLAFTMHTNGGDHQLDYTPGSSLINSSGDAASAPSDMHHSSSMLKSRSSIN